MLTYDDLERARDATSDRLELIEGELFVTPAPSLWHQDVEGQLYILFREAVQHPNNGRVYLSPVDVRLAQNTVVQPDLVVVLPERYQILTPAMIEGAPSLVVEIISPSSSAQDRVTKRALYARHGVPEYWLVDPDARSVTILSDSSEGRYNREEPSSDTAASATIPELTVDLAALFAPVPGL
jgi:Uma2 family endonuclease